MIHIPENKEDIKEFTKIYNLLVVRNKEAYIKDMQELSAYLRNILNTNNFSIKHSIKYIYENSFVLNNNWPTGKQAKILYDIIQKHYIF